MDGGLIDLFAKYEALMDDMDAAERPRRLDFQRFEAIWIDVVGDRELKQIWLDRLRSGLKAAVYEAFPQRFTDQFVRPDEESAAA